MWQGFRRIRPVFVIGSYRSATSVVTWALGQHPNIFPLEETHFLYKLAVDLDNLYELGTSPGERSFMGMARYTARDFRGYVAGACHQMILDARRRIVRHSCEIGVKDPSQSREDLLPRLGFRRPKRRWVDGTPENAHFVLPLLRLFPGARFIHVLRNPRRVATSLMHFSTMGSFDYAQEEAYRTWTRLAGAAALAEQALGPTCVMRLAHEDLLSDPKGAVTRCLSFIGEEYHDGCLRPLREKMNSSKYADAGNCSLEANIDSPQPWIREAFELYARLIGNKGAIDGGASAARRVLRANLREYRLSLKAATNENLARENASLRARVMRLEQERRHVDRSLGSFEHSLQVLDWGPQEIQAGFAFNEQPDGNSALWVSTRNAPPDTTIVLKGVALATNVDPSGCLVTATVPRRLIAQPDELTMTLRSASCNETSPPIKVRVEG